MYITKKGAKYNNEVTRIYLCPQAVRKHNSTMELQEGISTWNNKICKVYYKGPTLKKNDKRIEILAIPGRIVRRPTKDEERIAISISTLPNAIQYLFNKDEKGRIINLFLIPNDDCFGYQLNSSEGDIFGMTITNKKRKRIVREDKLVFNKAGVAALKPRTTLHGNQEITIEYKWTNKHWSDERKKV